MPRLSAVLAIFSSLALACTSGESVVREGYLPGAEGARLHYRVLGPAQGSGHQPIVVVHGGPGAGMHSILPSLKPFARMRRLIFYDQRGGGRSELPADLEKLQARYFVQDLEAVREHFGIERMDIIAHSFGAILVAEYARRHPDHLRRVVFHGATGPKRSQAAEIRRARSENAPPSPDPASAERASELLRTLLAGTAEDPIAACREYERIGRELAIAQGEEVLYRGTTCRAPPEAVRYYYHHTAQLTPASFGDWDYTRGLEDLSAPLLVVYGQDDAFGLRAQRAWVRAVPRGRLLLVPEAGKGALSANPNYVLPALEEFFQGRWPEGARAL